MPSSSSIPTVKKRLEDNLPRLETVLFQQQLGTLRDKTDRIQALAGWIAEQIGADVNHATPRGPAVQVRPDDQHGLRVHRHPGRDGDALRAP